MENLSTPFSPSLISIYTEDIMREAEIENLGINIEGSNIFNLRYANDTTLPASTPNNIDDLVSRVNDTENDKFLKLNLKNKLMRVEKDHWTESTC